jgi:predicted HAD superfamily hydrolase
MSTFGLPHIARAVRQQIRLRRIHLPSDRFLLRRSVMVDMDARLEVIEANSRLRQEAAAEEAGRRKKEAEAEKASEQERQQHKETAREEFAGFLAGAAKGQNQ